jgi:uncharacterized protein (DUF2141 family)
MPFFLALAAAAAITASAPAPSVAHGADLVVVVEGVSGAGGVVHVDLCTSSTFLSERCAVSRTAPAHAGAVAVTLPDVPAGEYAIQAWYDRNADGEVNRNALGIPTEPLGFSRSPPLGLHGPSFARSAFVHGAEPQPVTVKVRKLF